jgi:tight adherence protein B
MKRLLGGLIALAGAATIAGPVAAQEAGGLVIGDTDTSAYPTVVMEVSAPAGLEGLALAPDALTVIEGDVTLPAAAERIPTTNLQVMLVMDTSGSMEGEAIVAAKSAASAFVNVLPPEVDVGLVGFSDLPYLVVGPTTDRSALLAGIASLGATGETALYDAITFSVGQFTPTASDRAIVLLSDGGDTVSANPLEQAVAAANAVRLDAIELVSSEANRAALDQLAAAGNGTVSSATDPAALNGLYQNVASTLVNRYRVTYQSQASGSTQVVVQLTTPIGLLEGSTTIDLPAVAIPATTAPPESSAPPTTVGTFTPGTGVIVDDPTPPTWMLVVGAISFFVALTLLVLASLPSRRGSRQSRRQLGIVPAADHASAASQLGGRMSDAADRVLEHRGGRSIAHALEAAGINMRPGEFVVMVTGFTLTAAIIGFIAVQGVGLLVALVLVPLIARAILEHKADKRRREFADQLPETLQLIVSTLRSGYGLLQALDAVTAQAPQPTHDELQRAMLEIRIGRDPTEALAAVAARMRSVDFEWVVAGIDINREVGGDLAQILENVAETIRERHRLEGQIRTLTAEGRISAYILVALPFVLAGILSLINPGYLSALKSGAGLVLIIMGVILMIVGWIWMRRLVKSVSL